MVLVPIGDLLAAAKTKKYAVGQFNMNNLEFTQAIIEAAADKYNIPVVLESRLKRWG